MKVVKVQIPNDANIEEATSNQDIFYGEIYIATDHLEAWAKEYNNLTLKEMSLIEEMSELTQAISKAYRHAPTKSYSECTNPIKEEMAHVLISLKGLAWGLGIRPEDIQAEIEKKWPAAYEPKKGECKDCYWSMKTQHDNDLPVLRCVARCNAACDCCGPCNGFAKKEEK